MINKQNKYIFDFKIQYIKLKRAEKVIPLLAISSTIKVQDEKLSVDSVLLLLRTTITKAFRDENYLHYEFAPYSLYLFDELGMRKSQQLGINDCYQ